MLRLRGGRLNLLTKTAKNMARALYVYSIQNLDSKGADEFNLEKMPEEYKKIMADPTNKKFKGYGDLPGLHDWDEPWPEATPRRGDVWLRTFFPRRWLTTSKGSQSTSLPLLRPSSLSVGSQHPR